MIKQKITNQPVNFKMDKPPHKHRKGFREDAQLLGEAYDNVVNEALPGLIAGGIMGGKAAAKTGLFKKSTGIMTGAAIGDSLTNKGGSGESQTTTTYTSDEEGEYNFKVGDWVYDSDGSHASIISIDGDEVVLYDGKEGWSTHISEIKPQGAGEGLYPKSLGGGGSITSSQKFLGNDENEEGELSDDYTNPNYRGDPHDFQPGEIIEVGPWGPNDEADHLEVVLQVKGDVINTVPIADDAYGVQYGGKGGRDISLIRPQSELGLDSQEQFTPMEFPSDEEY